MSDHDDDGDDDGAVTTAPGGFRSVLAHEPLPIEEFGFLHMQGSFEPKIKETKPPSKEKELPKTDSSSANHHPTLIEPIFWDKARLAETLLQALSGNDNHKSWNLPHAAVSVSNLDSSPPYTKFRITYASSREALEVVIAWKQQKLSPQHLLGHIMDTNNQQQQLLQFSTRQLQVTQITRAPFPAVAWTRPAAPRFRRLIAKPGEDVSALQQERMETRFVFVTGLLDNHEFAVIPDFWHSPRAVIDVIRKALTHFDTSGDGMEVFVSYKKLNQSCHVGLRSPEDAKNLIVALQGKKLEWRYDTSSTVQQVCSSGKLFLDYAGITWRCIAQIKARDEGKESPKGEASHSECTSTTANVIVPGLAVIENFVSPQQEEVMLAVLNGPHAPWAPSQCIPSKTGIVKRKVQHFGYVFDYETADVLRDRSQPGADCPPMPAMPTTSRTNDDDDVRFDDRTNDVERRLADFVADGRGWEALACLIEKVRQFDFASFMLESQDSLKFETLNQLTVNCYAPGEGIGSHVDTPSAFSDGLISISLHGGIVMEFRKAGMDHRIPGNKKFVYLPPRSLVLMSGPARYEWEHMIVTRKTDTHNGKVLPRLIRLSLTLRTAIDEKGPLARVESCKFPPRWGRRVDDNQSIATPTTEREHVHAVYDAIATQWHHTRGKRGVLWPGATQWIKNLTPGSIVADVGCGDGKYFPAFWEAGCYVIGTDISRPLLKTSFLAWPEEDTPENRQVSGSRRHLRDRPALAVADCMSVPLRSKSCDAAVAIALMHHLSTEARRRRCIEELVRIVKVGGTINIQAWAIEQEGDAKRRFAATDVFVPFNAQPKYLDKADVSAEVTSPSNDEQKETKSVAQVYSEAYEGAEFDEKKGLVVFQRYCHLYRKGELESLVDHIPGVSVVESYYEKGNHCIVIQVLR